MHSLAIDQKTNILHTLVEGCSIRSTERLTGHHQDTMMRLLIKAGKKAELVLNSMGGIFKRSTRFSQRQLEGDLSHKS